MPNRNNQRIFAIISCPQSSTPILAGLPSQVQVLTSLLQLIGLQLHLLLRDSINVEHSFADTYRRQVLQHSNVTGAPKITRMQNAVPIH